MKKSIEATKEEFESSSGKTEQYLAWHKLFKKEFTALLVETFKVEKKDILIGKVNHFDISGFFKLNEKWAYFSIGDLRWDKDDMLIRVARNEKDYTGERNNYISLESSKVFILGMERFLKDNKYV